MNKTHSTNVLAINRAKLALNENLKTRKAVGFAIHQLIKARNNADTEFEKQEYTDIISTIYNNVYTQLTGSIYDNLKTIKLSKKNYKNSQHIYDKYCWLRDGVEIKFDYNGETKHGRIAYPYNIDDYITMTHEYGTCFINVLTLEPKTTLFGKTKMKEGILMGVRLNEIDGFYNGNNYIKLKQDEIS
jgi:hypothetical protein